jgi:hypothetical protein
VDLVVIAMHSNVVEQKLRFGEGICWKNDHLERAFISLLLLVEIQKPIGGADGVRDFVTA